VLGGSLREAGLAKVIVGAVVAFVTDADNVIVAAVADGWVAEGCVLCGSWSWEDGSVASLVRSTVSMRSEDKEGALRSVMHVPRLSMGTMMSVVVSRALRKRDDDLQSLASMEADGLAQLTL